MMFFCDNTRVTSPKRSATCLHGGYISLKANGDYIVAKDPLSKQYLNYDVTCMMMADLESVCGKVITDLCVEQHSDRLNDEYLGHNNGE